MIRRRVVVHGHVQGVFFRETLRRRAQTANVADGSRTAPTARWKASSRASGTLSSGSWTSVARGCAARESTGWTGFCPRSPRASPAATRQGLTAARRAGSARPRSACRRRSRAAPRTSRGHFASRPRSRSLPRRRRTRDRRQAARTTRTSVVSTTATGSSSKSSRTKRSPTLGSCSPRVRGEVASCSSAVAVFSPRSTAATSFRTQLRPRVVELERRQSAGHDQCPQRMQSASGSACSRKWLDAVSDFGSGAADRRRRRRSGRRRPAGRGCRAAAPPAPDGP